MKIEGASKNTKGWGRKQWLAAVLCVLMVGMLTRSLHGLYLEGDEICRVLQKKLERTPGKRMPCTRLTYLVEPVDWFALMAASGVLPGPVATSYQFDDDGELSRVETVNDGREIVYDCSVIGKMLMPVTNYEAWSSYAAFSALSKRSGPAEDARVVDEGGTGVSGLHTEVRVTSDNAFLANYVAETRANGGHLVRRIVHGSVSDTITDTSFEYDDDGNLISQRSAETAHPLTLVRQTDYTYGCWYDR